MIFQCKSYNEIDFPGFCIVKNHKKMEFFTKDLDLFKKIRKFLSSKFILLDFNADYDLQKKIGSGNYANVNFFSLYTSIITNS